MTMRRAATWQLLALCTIGTTGIAAAAESPYAEASLARPLPAATETEVDGVSWHCRGDKCVATVTRRATDSRMNECRKAAAALGRLTAYSSRGRQMSERELEACNRAAR